MWIKIAATTLTKRYLIFIFYFSSQNQLEKKKNFHQYSVYYRMKNLVVFYLRILTLNVSKTFAEIYKVFKNKFGLVAPIMLENFIKRMT